MITIAPEQRERLEAIRAKGFPVRSLYRRALDVVLDMHEPAHDLAEHEKLADEIAEGAPRIAPVTERERQLAAALRVAIARSKADRLRADEADARWQGLRSRMRSWGEQLADELRKY